MIMIVFITDNATATDTATDSIHTTITITSIIMKFEAMREGNESHFSGPHGLDARGRHCCRRSKHGRED
jgi:hypothetical protein